MFSKASKIVKQLQKNEFELFLQEIILLDPKKEIEFLLKGMGVVKIKDSSLYFTMYIKEQNHVFDHSKFISELSKNKEDELNTFEALDSDGYKWEFKTLSFSENHSFCKESLNSIFGEIHSLSLIEKVDNQEKEDSISYFFDLKYTFPLNEEEKIVENVNGKLNSFYFKDKILCQLDTIKVESNDDKHARIITFTTHNHDKNFDIRILEGLRFITGCDVSPYLVIRKSKGVKCLKIFGDLQLKNNMKINPPLQVLNHKSSFASDSWKLFEKYLLYISSHKGIFYSKLSASLNAILGSSNSYLETKILVLCVRVEGIVNFLYPEHGKPDKIFCEQIENLKNTIHTSEISENVCKRVIPLIDQTKQSRVYDKLNSLKDEGIINETQLSSWKTLRNKYSHSGNFSVKKDIDDEFYKYFNTLEMLYRLILFAIEYSGKYTNTKWKEVEFKKYKNRCEVINE